MTDDLLGYSVHFVFGGIVSLMSWFFGGRDGFLMVLLTFMVIDQFSGIATGWAEHKISSEAGFKGILKKCLILAFVGMAHLMDEYLFAHTVFGSMRLLGMSSLYSISAMKAFLLSRMLTDSASLFPASSETDSSI